MLGSFGGKFSFSAYDQGMIFTRRTIGLRSLSLGELKVRNALQNNTLQGQQSGILERHSRGGLDFQHCLLKGLNELF